MQQGAIQFGSTASIALSHGEMIERFMDGRMNPLIPE